MRESVRPARLMVALAFLLFSADVRAEDQRSATVGMPAKIDQIVLPGSELEVKPLEDARTPIVLRLIGVFPHGSAYRYDFVYYGLEPGTFDLRNFLRRKDASSLGDLPSLKVEIKPVLPPGQILPHEPEARRSPFRWQYRILIGVGLGAWALGLLAILFYRRKRGNDAVGVAEKPMTIAEKLRPMVEGAMQGRLSQSQLADLERTLILYWRRRLKMEEMRPGEAIHQLRLHQEAGPLLLLLETWLHRPGASAEVNVAELLRPHRDLPIESLDDFGRQ